MEIKSMANPTGAVQSFEEIDAKLDSLVEVWDSQVVENPVSWWQFWKSKINFTQVTNFLMNSVDDLIKLVESLLGDGSGADKKATVLDAIDRLYDYVTAGALPIWLSPFAAAIKQYVVYTLISNAIDYFVAKYNDGSWPELKTE